MKTSEEIHAGIGELPSFEVIAGAIDFAKKGGASGGQSGGKGGAGGGKGGTGGGKGGAGGGQSDDGRAGGGLSDGGAAGNTGLSS
jgi:hypothetical protein